MHPKRVRRKPGTDSDEASSTCNDRVAKPSESLRSRMAGQFRPVAVPAMLSCLALWAAFPPLEWGLLAWIAPVGLVGMIANPSAPRWTGYTWLWIAGCFFWLAILQGIRLAFWPLTFGWLAISLYLGIYLPLFVGVARILHYRWHWPLAWSAPVAWTGLELFRSYFLTGFAANTLAHTQFRYPVIIQIADQFGGYGLSFVIVSIAVAIFRFAQWRFSPKAPTPSKFPRLDLLIAASLLAITIGYGVWRLNEGDALAASEEPLLSIALIQENTPSMFDADLEDLKVGWERYCQATAQALRENGPVHLVVWPESTFTINVAWMEDQTDGSVPDELIDRGYDRQSLKELVAEYHSEFDRKVDVLHSLIAQGLNASQPREAVDHGSSNPPEMPFLMVGNDAYIIRDRVDRFNSALWIDPTGKVLGHYDKIHLVMFGEYIPLRPLLGFLGDAFGFSGATPGRDMQSFELNGVRIAPSICFESMLPQMMAWQMRSLVAVGKPPDILINITNDSWFRGSSILDHHLACNTLTSVEMRRPMLVAANTGISAWIEGSGRIKSTTERLKAGHIIAKCKRDSRFGMTQLWGDLPAWCIAIVCGMALVAGRRKGASH